MEYVKSKQNGDIGEIAILERVVKQYPNAYIDDIGKANSNWDIFVPEIKEGIEVKCDYKSKETGNLVVEVEMNGNLSALSTTKAKYWVFITGYNYVWITPLEIYRFIEQHFEYGRVPFTGDGDNNGKLAYLVSLNAFIKHIRNNLSKDVAWIETINENDIMYYDNYIEIINKQ